MQLRRLSGVLVVVALLAACGGGATPANVPATPTQANSAPAATVAATTVPVAPAPPTVGPSPATPILASPTRAASPATPTQAATRPPATPATATTSSSFGPPIYPTQPRNLGQPVAQTAHFRFYDPEGTQAATIAALVAEAEEIYTYLVARTGLELAAPLPVVVQTQAASDCAARGVAYRDGPRIGIFATSATPLAQLRLVLAHETAHALHMPHYGRRLDVTLIEGFATWASLRYWSEWQGLASFDDAARAYLADGRFLPLDNPPPNCTIATRDVLYNERASFVAYLIATYGLDRFLVATNTAIPSQGGTLEVVADYEGVYGQSFALLLADWARSLASR